MREHATQNTGAGCPRVPEGPWQRDRDTRDNRGMPWWLRMWEKVGRMSCRGFGDRKQQRKEGAEVVREVLEKSG